ncbi:hypothetical protein K2X33_01240 [bacterium]|nr:hypothetical protein [bacterium]
MFFLQPSQKKLLSSLNPLFFIFAVFGLILAKTACYPLAPHFIQHWDLLLPFIVFFGQRRELPEGIILSLFSAHLFSLASGAPLGVYTTAYLVIFALARLISYVAYATTLGSILLLMIGLSAISRIVLPLVASFFHPGWPILSLYNLVWWSILLNGLAGWAIYIVLVGVDRLTNKVSRSSIEFSGDAL